MDVDCSKMAPNTVSQLPTPSLTAKKSYKFYTEEVALWQAITEVKTEKQAIWLALALPDDHPDGLKEKVMGSGVGSTKITGDNGVANLLAFLDTMYEKDTFVDLLEAYKKVENFKQEKNDSMEKYIAEFNCRMLDANKKAWLTPSSSRPSSCWRAPGPPRWKNR